jgi:hypothetical protein
MNAGDCVMSYPFQHLFAMQRETFCFKIPTLEQLQLCVTLNLLKIRPNLAQEFLLLTAVSANLSVTVPKKITIFWDVTWDSVVDRLPMFDRNMLPLGFGLYGISSDLPDYTVLLPTKYELCSNICDSL